MIEPFPVILQSAFEPSRKLPKMVNKLSIQVLVEHLDKLQRTGERVNVGEMSFCVEGVSVLESRVGRSCVLAAGTPIVVRIPRANYARYGIEPPEARAGEFNNSFLGGRPNLPFDRG